MTADGYRVSFWGDENGLKLIVVIVHSSVSTLKAIELYTLMCELYDVGISLNIGVTENKGKVPASPRQFPSPFPALSFSTDNATT